MQHKELADIYLIVSNNIKKYRLRNNITQKELAIKSGYSYNYIRQIEAKKCIKNFSIQTIYDISTALNVSIVQLFEKDDI